jgi:hypothetical protein
MPSCCMVIGTVFQIPLLLDHPYSIPNPTVICFGVICFGDLSFPLGIYLSWHAGSRHHQSGTRPKSACWTVPSPDLHDGSSGLRSGATTKKCDMIVCCNAICGELLDSCEFRLHLIGVARPATSRHPTRRTHAISPERYYGLQQPFVSIVSSPRRIHPRPSSLILSCDHQ